MGWKERGEALIARAEVGDMNVAVEGLALVNERLDAEGLRHKVWGAMPYRCDGDCGVVAWYEMEVGVEGPEEWRAENTFIASPFTAGRCDGCHSTMTHVMNQDVIYPQPQQPGEPIPNVMLQATRVFRVPREPVRYTTHGCDPEGNVIYSEATHAFLAIDMSMIPVGRRSWV